MRREVVMSTQLIRAGDTRVSRAMASWLLIALLAVIVAACGPIERFDAVPLDAENQAAIPNMKGIRFWADGDPAEMAKAGLALLDREKAYLASTGHKGPLPPADFLAISGGGENGAF